MKILELKSIVYKLKKKILGWAYQQTGDNRRNSEHEDRSIETQSEEIRGVKQGDPINSLPYLQLESQKEKKIQQRKKRNNYRL